MCHRENFFSNFNQSQPSKHICEVVYQFSRLKNIEI